ncbi:MAG: PsbP-related protein [Candidatus Daviesbacteria bacterium]
MKEKGFTLIVFILVILIISAGIVGGAFYIKQNSLIKSQSQNSGILSQAPQLTVDSQSTPTPSLISSASSNEISNWKTYTNDKYYYSVKYPSNWFLTEIQDSTTVNIDNSPISSLSPTQELPKTMQIRIGRIQEKHISPWKPTSADYAIDPIIVGGITGTKYTDKKPDKVDGLFHSIALIDSGNISYVIIYTNYDNKGTHDQIFDQILSSFKFLDQK